MELNLYDLKTPRDRMLLWALANYYSCKIPAASNPAYQDTIGPCFISTAPWEAVQAVRVGLSLGESWAYLFGKQRRVL
jgi:hypothetical protein